MTQQTYKITLCFLWSVLALGFGVSPKPVPSPSFEDFHALEHLQKDFESVKNSYFGASFLATMNHLHDSGIDAGSYYEYAKNATLISPLSPQAKVLIATGEFAANTLMQFIENSRHRTLSLAEDTLRARLIQLEEKQLEKIKTGLKEDPKILMKEIYGGDPILSMGLHEIKDAQSQEIFQEFQIEAIKNSLPKILSESRTHHEEASARFEASRKDLGRIMNTMGTLKKSISELRQSQELQINAVQALAAELKTSAEKTHGIQEALQDQNSTLNLLLNIEFQKLPAKQQLELLKNKLAFKSLSEVDRKKLEKQIEFTLTRQKITDSLLQLHQATGVFVQAISVLPGVSPRFTQKATQACNVLQNTTNIFSSLVSGNYLGVISGVFSMFEKQGPDVSALRHEQVMTTLNRLENKIDWLMDGQKRIEFKLDGALHALSQISRFLMEHRTEIISTLENMEASLYELMDYYWFQNTKDLASCKAVQHALTQSETHIESRGQSLNQVINRCGLSLLDVLGNFYAYDSRTLPAFWSSSHPLSAEETAGSSALHMKWDKDAYIPLLNYLHLRDPDVFFRKALTAYIATPSMQWDASREIPAYAKRLSIPWIEDYYENFAMRSQKLLSIRSILELLSPLPRIAFLFDYENTVKQNVFCWPKDISKGDCRPTFNGQYLLKAALPLIDSALAQWNLLFGRGILKELAESLSISQQEEQLSLFFALKNNRALRNNLMRYLIAKGILKFGNAAFIEAYKTYFINSESLEHFFELPPSKSLGYEFDPTKKQWSITFSAALSKSKEKISLEIPSPDSYEANPWFEKPFLLNSLYELKAEILAHLANYEFTQEIKNPGLQRIWFEFYGR